MAPDLTLIERAREVGKRYDGMLYLQLADSLERLRAASEAVCWFDWSDNDNDAVAAVAALRAVLEKTR